MRRLPGLNTCSLAPACLTPAVFALGELGPAGRRHGGCSRPPSRLFRRDPERVSPVGKASDRGEMDGAGERPGPAVHQSAQAESPSPAHPNTVRILVGAPAPAGRAAVGAVRLPAQGGYLVDPASSHMLVSKIKPCMSKYELLIL